MLGWCPNERARWIVFDFELKEFVLEVSQEFRSQQLCPFKIIGYSGVESVLILGDSSGDYELGLGIVPQFAFNNTPTQWPKRGVGVPWTLGTQSPSRVQNECYFSKVRSWAESLLHSVAWPAESRSSQLNLSSYHKIHPFRLSVILKYELLREFEF